MASFFRFLGCFICESEKTGVKEIDDHAAVPVQVQYTKSIEGKDSQLCSDSSFDSEAEFLSKDEKASIAQNVYDVQSVQVVPVEPPRPVLSERSRSNRALIVASKGTYAFAEHPFPELEHEREVVIRNHATGLNPIDFKSVDYNFCLPEFPWVTGREMAGTVEHVGREVEREGEIKVGDKVWTSTYYKDRRAGCFQSFVTVPAHTVLPLPQGLGFDDAACLGVAGLTAAMTIWRWFGVPISTSSQSKQEEEEYLLIWGGSTITGQFAIQIAQRCGINVIAVTSEKTSSLASTLGATVVTRDGKTGEEIVREIRGIAGDKITRAIDLVGTTTASYCLSALSTSKPCLFTPLAMISSKAIIPANITVETVEMKQFVLNPENRVYALELNRLVEEGKLVLPSVEVLEGGLDVITVGLERLKGGDMGGRKMVVRMI